MSAMLCDFERENVLYSDLIKDEFGIRGAAHYTIQGPGPAVDLVFKQHDQVKSATLEHMRTLCTHFLNTSGVDSVVLLLQAGTWYHSPTLFRRHLAGLFSAVHDLAEKFARQHKHVSFVWAEQIAQHWPTDNGYFLTGKGVSLGQLCTPLANASAEADWRNDIVWESYLRDGSPWRLQIAALAPYAQVHVLSFRALTSGMSDFHVRQQKRDCTHFCYTPMMHQPIYHQLAKISQELAVAVAQTKSLRSSY
jgi:hypothetical protein